MMYLKMFIVFILAFMFGYLVTSALAQIEIVAESPVVITERRPPISANLEELEKIEEYLAPVVSSDRTELQRARIIHVRNILNEVTN